MKVIEEDKDWIDTRLKVTEDEQLFIKIYRFCKVHYEFIIGLAVGIVLTTIILK